MIRCILATLMALCLLAGPEVRATMADDCGTPETADACLQTHLDAAAPHDDHHPGDECPVDHHCHHGCCAHVHSLEAGLPAATLPATAGNARGHCWHEDETRPDGPFPSREKPPLI